MTGSERAQRFAQRLILTAKGSRSARTMTRQEAHEALGFLLSLEADSVQVAAFLTAMRFKGAEVDELLGFCDAIKEHMVFINPKVDNLLDISGPYDGREKSLHLGIAAAMIAVAQGVNIVMHSSTGLPPKRGLTTAHVLESLGIPAFLEPPEVEKRIEKTGFGFIHASQFSYGIEGIRPIREKLIFRTFLQNCEILNNPAQARLRLMGVAHEHFMKKLVTVAQIQGAEHAISVPGLDGSDELPLTPVNIVEYKKGKIHTLELDPEDYGLSHEKKHACKNSDECAEITYEALSDTSHPCSNAIIYNGALRIYLGRKSGSLASAIETAKETLQSGKALKKLQEIAAYPHALTAY